MKKSFTIIILIFTLIALCSLVHGEPVISVTSVEVDYIDGLIIITGKAGAENEGITLTLKIFDSSNNLVDIRPMVAGNQGVFQALLKISAIYTTDTYEVIVSGVDSIEGSGSFSIDADKDIFEVRNVMIKGAQKEGDEYFSIENQTLTVDFDFFSSFTYDIGETVYEWQVAGAQDGTFYTIPGANTKEYTFATADMEVVYNSHKEEFADGNFHLRCKVKAKTEKSESYSQDAFSENTVRLVTIPYAKAVSVVGTVGVGLPLQGKYTFFDLQNKKEEQSIYTWLISETKNSEPIRTVKGLTFIPQTLDGGKYVRFEVTPRVHSLNLEGNPVQSNEILIPSTNYVSRGGNGGGGYDGGSAIIAPPMEAPEEAEITKSHQGFADVPADHWAYEDITAMHRVGMLHGRSQEEFAPDAPITRAEAAKLLISALGNSPATYTDAFIDIYASQWYSGYVIACYEMGLIHGTDGMFYPDSPITRQEMAKIIALAIDFPVPDQAAITFIDEDHISDWAMEGVKKCATLGMIQGMPDGSFEPHSYLTRGQTAAIINRFYQLQGGDGS